jgi:hypothetical protein
MRHILRFVQVFALGTWVGSIFYFSAAVAPGAFRVLTSQDQAGLLVEFTLGRLHLLGVVVAVLFLLASILLALMGYASGKFLPSVGVLVMLALTLISQDVVIRPMIHLRREMVSVVATPADNPARAEFDRLHGVSVDLEAAVLLIGFASLFLTVREESRVYRKWDREPPLGKSADTK